MRSTLLLAAILLLAPRQNESLTGSTHDKVYVFHHENVLGTSLELKIIASSPAQSEQAEKATLAEIDRESHILSSWDPGSEFSSWFRTTDQPVHISPELFEVLSLFDEWRDRTHGALDASAEAITRVWNNAAAEKRLPTDAELRAAVASVVRVHWKLDPGNRTATHTSDVPLAMNSFVKSYIAGRAADAALGASGVRAAVVNIGGDLVVRGEWSEHVDVADPKSDAENGVPIARLVVRNRTVATSGDYRRGVEILGQHYSHIVDPRTGMPADEIISSTVVAPVARRCWCPCHLDFGTDARGRCSFGRVDSRRGIYAGEKERRNDNERRVECARSSIPRTDFSDAARGLLTNSGCAVWYFPMEWQL